MSTTAIIGSRYEIINQLSEGGFGRTYIGKDLHTPSQRLCVVKQLKPIDENPEIYQIVKERFEKEATILEQLGEENPQIPKLYAYCEVEENFYLVEELIEGKTLTNIRETEGNLSENHVKDLLIKILYVLEYIQKKSIIHRDIKPDNIIVRSSDKMPVLIDFGAVKGTMSTTVTTEGNSTQSIVIGTRGFMPPEQSVGRPVYASDLYALGLTAIYLLTGKIPEQLENDPLTGEFIWQQYAPNLNFEFSQVLDKAIKANARDRFATAVQMREALQKTKSIIIATTMINTQNSLPLPATELSPQITPTIQSISNSSPSMIQNSGLSRGQIISLLVAVLGLIATGSLAYSLYQQQQQFQEQIARLEAQQQEEKQAKLRAEKEKLEREKQELEQEKQELENKLNQQHSTPKSQINTIYPSPKKNRTNNNLSTDLSWKPACGSPQGSGSIWYPVLGDTRALNMIKNHYCGDAFIAKNGNLQVASFTSIYEAEEFASALSKATGYDFWVKY